jgi:DNA-binding response OmpR family regulator
VHGVLPKILIVDDDRTVLHMVQKSLHEGVEVLTARSAEEALATIGNAHPDVVLLDIMLPGLSGLEIFKQIQALEQRNDHRRDAVGRLRLRR